MIHVQDPVVPIWHRQLQDVCYTLTPQPFVSLSHDNGLGYVPRSFNHHTGACMPSAKKPPVELRLRVLSAIDYAPGNSVQARIRAVADRTFIDNHTQVAYRFTWRTISTWLYRFKKHGLTCLDNKTRADKNAYRKVQVNELAEAIHEVMPSLRVNKVGVIPKSVLYRQLLKHNLLQRHQLAPTTFYRMVRENQLLKEDTQQKLRLSFAMPFANDLWQADTLYGPSIKQADGKWRKTFLIAFIDDASRVITHSQFFYRDNTDNMIEAFRTALYKRGKPARLYVDNGANYISQEILKACLRLNIKLTHAPVRDGAAKGKIERFFRGFRDRFLTQHPLFDSLEDLNQKSQHWVERDYNAQHHSGIQMIPLDRFNLDLPRIKFLTDDEFSEEVFFAEEDRMVSKTNVFSINSQKFECPVDLREKKIQVRFNRSQRDRFIVYFAGQRMGPAEPLDLHFNAKRRAALLGEPLC
jgi:transposase InsO family protein